MLAVNTGRRSPGAIGLIAAAAGAAGLISEDPVKEAASSVLTMFSLSSDNTELEVDIDNLLQLQTVFQKTSKRVQKTTNISNYFETKYKKVLQKLMRL